MRDPGTNVGEMTLTVGGEQRIFGREDVLAMVASQRYMIERSRHRNLEEFGAGFKL